MRAPGDPLYDDFRNFLYVIWRHLGLPDPTPVQYDIALRLQHGPRRDIVEAFRGVGKSWITAAYVAWRLYRDAQDEILVVSASKVRADDFTTFVMRLILEVPILQFLAPKDNQRNSKIAFDVGPKRASQSPSVKSVGITGQITGSRANCIIPDDIEIPGNSGTQGQRDKLAELVKEFDAVLKPGGEVKFLGTPQTEQSLYTTRLPTRGYSVRIWPARYPDPATVAAYGDKLAPMIADAVAADPSLVGQPTDPRRFGAEDLMEREASYGRSGFALQFMLNPKLSDAERYPLKLADLIVMGLDTEMAPVRLAWGSGPDQVLSDLTTLGLDGDRFHRPIFMDQQMAAYTGCVMAIDPSGRGKDETSYAIIKMLCGYQFLVAAGGLQGGYEEHVLQALSILAGQHKVNQVLIEENFGQGMFAALLQPVLSKVHRCGIEEVRSSKQKEHRIIDTLEPVMNRHRLVVDPAVIKADWDTVQRYPVDERQHYSLFHQMTRITREKGALRQDDRLDAVAMASAYWAESMARDEDKAAASIRAKLLDDELRKFMSHATGRPAQTPAWVRTGQGLNLGRRR